MAAAAPPPIVARHPPRCSLELKSRPNIRFLHPGYDTLNLLLTLPRVDAPPPYGVYHRTALLACQIIAGNTFNNSRFALDRAGQQLVQVPLDGILIDAQYYFIIDSSNLYPIVPSFQDWQFPHDYIPDFWPQITSSSTATCGITNNGFAIDGAHLVPQKERAWYNDNGMSRYGLDPPDIDNQANILPLRKDIHYYFDNRWFVIVPKIAKVENGSVAPSTQYVTHIITPNAAELWPIYHNTLVESLESCSRPYLFARFAWAILLRVKLFVISGRPRYVFQIHKDVEGGVKYEEEHCTGKMLSTKYGGGGSQAASSKKRRSEYDSTRNDDEISLESSGEESDINMVDIDGRYDLMDDWNNRGRREIEVSSDESASDTKLHLASDVEALDLAMICCRGRHVC